MRSKNHSLHKLRVEQRFTSDGITPTPGNSVGSEYDKVIRKLRQSVSDIARYELSRHSPLVPPFPCTPWVHRSVSNELASLDLSLLSSRRSGQRRVPRRLIPIRSCESRSAIVFKIFEADLDLTVAKMMTSNSFSTPSLVTRPRGVTCTIGWFTRSTLGRCSDSSQPASKATRLHPNGYFGVKALDDPVSFRND